MSGKLDGVKEEKDETDPAFYEIRLDKEAEDHAVYIDTSVPGATVSGGPQYEQRISTKYLSHTSSASCYRVETFRSDTTLPNSKDQKLRCYFVYKCEFANPKPEPYETRIDVVGEKRFLQKATNNTKDIYQEILKRAVKRTGPVIEFFDIEGSRDKRLVLAYKRGSANGLFAAMSDLVSFGKGAGISDVSVLDRQPTIATDLGQQPEAITEHYSEARPKF